MNAMINYLLEAKRIAPDDPLVASELGRVFIERNQASEALSEYGRAVALRPGDPLALNNRGVALLMLGIREHALTDFREALKINPCLMDARNNLRLAAIQAARSGIKRRRHSITRKDDVRWMARLTAWYPAGSNPPSL